LDEPTIGLHPKDNDRLIQTLLRLRDLGNTVIVVEHDENVIKAADHLVDFGPLAGEHGGQIIAQGDVAAVMSAPKSLTGQYLSKSKTIDSSNITLSVKHLPRSLRLSGAKTQLSQNLTLTHASKHNLKDLSISFPLNQLVVVSGISGSGKSTLINDTLYYRLKHVLDSKPHASPPPTNITGFDTINKVYMIDQSPIGRTPRSNPATYTKAFDHIRQIFAETKDSKALGYKPGRFSFNVPGGRCEACQGGGQVKISMQFLSDVYITCEVCQGTRYNAETQTVLFQHRSISDVLDLTINEAAHLFQFHTGLSKKLDTLKAVGLGYLKLGQPAPTLSGGEAQRVKLAKELSVNSPLHTVYLLDEPTTGLHFEDVKKLLIVLKLLVQNNNSVIVIEHNLDVIKNADWVIDLGPEGGQQGGQIVAEGTPLKVSHQPQSYTGQYLRHMM
jgi:excinuclease ABC subunit A